uniref:Vasopressin V1a receptor n=1 Tax=Ascaris suum TaxID=6253 RepID=F1L168_ASCSU
MALHPQILFIVIHMAAVMTLAILGNLFLVLIIVRGNAVIRRRISPVQLLLLHTCVADLLFALLSLGTEILIILTYPYFEGPGWLCQLVRYLQMFPLYASPFLLVAISADRFQAICRPLANFRSDRFRRPNCLASAAWISALICSLPQIFIWYKTDSGECATIYGRGVTLLKSVYVISFNTVAWLLPSIMAASFYYCVCKAVWASNFPYCNDIQVSPATKLDVCNSQSFQTQFYVERIRRDTGHMKRQMTELDRKRVQTVRLTMTIIICNFFLWAPFCVVNVLQAFAPRLLSAELITYIVILGNLNSCVNPWIYILFNRNQVKRALCISTAHNPYSKYSEFAKDRKFTASSRNCRNSDAVSFGSSRISKKSHTEARRVESAQTQSATKSETGRRSASCRSSRSMRLLFPDASAPAFQNGSKEQYQSIVVDDVIVKDSLLSMRPSVTVSTESPRSL